MYIYNHIGRCHCVNTCEDEVRLQKCAKMLNLNCVLTYFADEVFSVSGVSDDCVASLSPGSW